MQALQNLKEINDKRFDLVDKRWGEVQDALKIQSKERKQDINILKERLQDRTSLSEILEKNKAKAISQNLSELLQSTLQSKQNLERLLIQETDFQKAHLQKKNCFIQSYNHSGQQFSERINEYQTAKLGQISSRLEKIDEINHNATLDTVKYVKEEKMAVAKSFIQGEKAKFADQLSKLRGETSKQIDDLRFSLREFSKKKEESQAKLQIMINSLSSQLSKAQQLQWKQGEIAYDCLLKLVEDACSKIQQSQYK